MQLQRQHPKHVGLVCAGHIGRALAGRLTAFAFMSLMLLSVSLRARPAASQEPTPAALPTMSAENQALAKRAGRWDATFTSWAKPGAQPEVTSGLIADRRMYGEMLQEVLRPGPAARVPAFVRVDDLTFNRLEGRWDYVSMDSRAIRTAGARMEPRSRCTGSYFLEIRTVRIARVKREWRDGADARDRDRAGCRPRS